MEPLTQKLVLRNCNYKCIYMYIYRTRCMIM